MNLPVSGKFVPVPKKGKHLYLFGTDAFLFSTQQVTCGSAQLLSNFAQEINARGENAVLNVTVSTLGDIELLRHFCLRDFLAAPQCLNAFGVVLIHTRILL